jgi:ankyrin repeat protein
LASLPQGPLRGRASCAVANSGAIHKAAETNNIKMLVRLLQLGFDLEQANKHGETAIVIAALHEATETVMFLRDKGANM